LSQGKDQIKKNVTKIIFYRSMARVKPFFIFKKSLHVFFMEKCKKDLLIVKMLIDMG
jgi:hypothetical protein